MQRFACGIVFLSQTDSVTVETLAKLPWYAVAFLAVGGSVGLAAAIRVVWTYATNYWSTKQQHAMKIAEEERALRAARHRAEIEQHEALAALARGVPEQFKSMTNEMREANKLTRDEVANNTLTLNRLIAALNDERHALMLAMAKKLGVQSDDVVANRQSNAGL
jgi:hypothetical protein